MEEEFKPIKGYEGKYLVGSHGTIISIQRSGKPLSPSRSKLGYLRVNLCKNGNVKTFSVHRLVALGFLPNNENKQQVNHKDGRHSNNFVSNLEWVNQSENMSHAFNVLKLHAAFKYSRAKLSEDDVLEIRSLYSLGASKGEISKAYGVMQSTVHKIINRLRWASLASC